MGSHRADRRAPRRRAPGASAADRTPRSRSENPSTGRRRASRHTGTRGPLFRGLPPAPVLLGVAALAISAGGAVTVGEQDVAPATHRLVAAGALSGSTGQSSSDLLSGRRTLSRDGRRDQLPDGDAGLVAEAEQMTRARNAALAQFARRAEKQSKKIALNQWVLPVTPAVTTAEFGQYGLWASYHTGLDFNGVEGQEIRSIANGVVTSVGYDGSYGNKTVVTLDDGTEIWYCHQSRFAVSEGQELHAGDLLGYIGSTGHVTGSHLHLEVRPGGGDPVDPRAAFVVHGVTP